MTDSPRRDRSATRYRATWLLPITSGPIRNGWVEVRDGTIVAYGSSTSEPPADSSARIVDLAGHIVLPALVNAHTHLELSGLRSRVAPAKTMPAWARSAMSAMSDHPPDDAAIRLAVDETDRFGTGVVGDISNTGASVGALSGRAAPSVLFTELLGFDVRDGAATVARAREVLRSRISEGGADARVHPGLAAHAPYSVSPALFRAIRDAVDDEPSVRLSVHLAESSEELEFLKTGTGAWRAVLEERGRWTRDWAPDDRGPVAYLDRLGWLTSRTLVVHGVHLTDSELEQLARAGSTLVTCPRSNQWTGAGSPPVGRFYASGVRVAVGTDSLASAPDLNVFLELAEIRRLAPDVASSAVLMSATRGGAEALGFPDRGSVEVGMQAELIAVRCAETLDDVEEYLLSGIEADDVAALDATRQDS